MCGIAGILNFDRRPADAEIVRKMNAVQAHRGPDGEGLWTDRALALGHRRLSIIDLSTAANQPMVSQDGQIAVVFNGEIYNYQDLRSELKSAGVQISTASDTEVLLHLYRRDGRDFVRKLRGMFAFAIWDVERGELFLARDRVGIKPLYYTLSQRGLAFASEIKAIASSGYAEMTIDYQALAGFLRFLVVPQPQTIFSSIEKLKPGCWLAVDMSGRIQTGSYWRVSSQGAPDSNATESEWADGLDRQLRASVSSHMVADVPVGAFLSGGVDSSIVVSMMREQAADQPIETFSIGFPGMARYDESRYARQVADLKGVGHNIGTIDPSFLDDFERMVWHLDEPFAVSSAFATWYLAEHAASETKVVLTGDGGDELFGGYEGYLKDHYLQAAPWAALSGPAQGLLGFAASMGLGGRLTRQVLAGVMRRAGSEGLRYSQRAAQNGLYAVAQAFNDEVFLEAVDAWKVNLMAHYYDACKSEVHLERKLYAEYKTRLVDEMLMKVDRMTMAHSLEARVPLLDHRVVEFAFTVPPSLKIESSEGRPELKYLLKRVMERYLPADLAYRSKQGFNIPVREWLQGDLLGLVHERITSGRLHRAGILDQRGISRLISEQSSNKRNHSNMFLVLLSLETWLGSYEERVGPVSWA